MPPLTGGEYLADYLFEMGPTKGETPIEAADLVAWEHLLGIEWQPWQARLLLRLSRAYLAESHRARDRKAPPPWDGFAAQWRWVLAKKMDRDLREHL